MAGKFVSTSRMAVFLVVAMLLPDVLGLANSKIERQSKRKLRASKKTSFPVI